MNSKLKEGNVGIHGFRTTTLLTHYRLLVVTPECSFPKMANPKSSLLPLAFLGLLYFILTPFPSAYHVIVLDAGSTGTISY